jgi:hypothetical protein
MAKALITARFPTTSEVAQKLGLPASRVRRVRTLMNLSEAGNGAGDGAEARKKALRRAGAKKFRPSTR